MPQAIRVGQVTPGDVSVIRIEVDLDRLARGSGAAFELVEADRPLRNRLVVAEAAPIGVIAEICRVRNDNRIAIVVKRDRILDSFVRCNDLVMTRSASDINIVCCFDAVAAVDLSDRDLRSVGIIVERDLAVVDGNFNIITGGI